MCMNKRCKECLTRMLAIKFLESCVQLENFSKKESNIFCIDCYTPCFHCIKSGCHRSNSRLQVYICNRRYVVRLEDLEKHFNCSKIQEYSNNRHIVVFLNARALKGFIVSKNRKFCSSCEVCGVDLCEQHNCFCSIACKIAAGPSILGDQEIRLIVLPLQISDKPATTEDDTPTELAKQAQPPSSPPKSFRLPHQLRKRKGIPRRSPVSYVQSPSSPPTSLRSLEQSPKSKDTSQMSPLRQAQPLSSPPTPFRSPDQSPKRIDISGRSPIRQAQPPSSSATSFNSPERSPKSKDISQRSPLRQAQPPSSPPTSFKSPERLEGIPGSSPLTQAQVSSSPPISFRPLERLRKRKDIPQRSPPF